MLKKPWVIKMNIPESIKLDTIQKNIWHKSCPVHLDNLTLLKVKYLNFEYVEQIGEIMVFSLLADHVSKIFQSLYEIKFPINKVSLINHYHGNDEASMADNNTSAFNCRLIKGTDRYSVHSYGMAIDINPLQNPYLYKDADNRIHVYPEEGKSYLDRENLRQGMITKEVVEIFANKGFDIWGGNWTLPDFHHFEVSKGKRDRILML